MSQQRHQKQAPPTETGARSLLAGNLRRLREEQDLRQEDVARTLKMAPRDYQRLEAGDCNPTLRTLVRLCKAFGVPIGQLFA